MGDMRSPEDYERSKQRDKQWNDQLVKDMRERTAPQFRNRIGARDADGWTGYKSTAIMFDYKYPFEVSNIPSDAYYYGFRSFVCRGLAVVLVGTKHMRDRAKPTQLKYEVIQLKVILPNWETHWFDADYNDLLEFFDYVKAKEDAGEFYGFNGFAQTRIEKPRFITPEVYRRVIRDHKEL